MMDNHENTVRLFILESLEAEFARAGGRSIELAEAIDKLRKEIEEGDDGNSDN